MKRVNQSDRKFAVVGLAVMLGKSGRRDAERFMQELFSEAVYTGSKLLRDKILIAVGNQSDRSWKRFVKEIEQRAELHRS